LLWLTYVHYSHAYGIIIISISAMYLQNNKLINLLMDHICLQKSCV